MMHRRLIAFSAVVLLVGLACNGLSDLTGTSGEIVGSGVESSTSGEVLFSDTFTHETSGWEIGEYPGGRVGYWNGAYYVTSLGDGQTMWGVANRGFDDVAIKVRSQQVTGPSNDNNDYGVICRVHPDGQGYFFLISGDGFFAILRADGTDSFEHLIDWTPSNVINKGNNANDIVATCEGDSLSLRVNGELLASVSDTRYRSGDIALTATSYEAESTEVHFDNLEVTRP